MSIFEQIRNAFGKATLWKIAVEVYGDGARYTEIFEANRDLLDSPDHILPGQELELPPA